MPLGSDWAVWFVPRPGTRAVLIRPVTRAAPRAHRHARRPAGIHFALGRVWRDLNKSGMFQSYLGNSRYCIQYYPTVTSPTPEAGYPACAPTWRRVQVSNTSLSFVFSPFGAWPAGPPPDQVSSRGIWFFQYCYTCFVWVIKFVRICLYSYPSLIWIYLNLFFFTSLSDFSYVLIKSLNIQLYLYPWGLCILATLHLWASIFISELSHYHYIHISFGLPLFKVLVGDCNISIYFVNRSFAITPPCGKNINKDT